MYDLLLLLVGVIYWRFGGWTWGLEGDIGVTFFYVFGPFVYIRIIDVYCYYPFFHFSFSKVIESNPPTF